MTQPAEQRRPAVVTAAGALMLVVALAALAVTVGLLVAAARFRGRYLPLAANTDAVQRDIDRVGDTVRTSMGVLAILVLVLAGVLALLAVGVLRRGRSARIGTWVLVAIGLLCGCGQGVAAGSAVSDVSYTGDPARVDVASQLTTAVQDALPSWLPGLVVTAALVQVVGYILVAVLLALPPANRYFRGVTQPVPWPAPAPGGTTWPAQTPFPTGPPPDGVPR